MKTTYSEKLKSPKWQKKRLEVFNRDSFACTYCADTETTLHVHHLKYSGQPWEAPLSDLITLCEHCHTIIEELKNDIVGGFKMTTDVNPKGEKMLFATYQYVQTGEVVVSIYRVDESKDLKLVIDIPKRRIDYLYKLVN